MKTIILSTLILAFSIPALAEPNYTLLGAWTNLWDQDVSYSSPPIILHRVKETFPLHHVQFSIVRRVRECLYWQRVCTQTDRRGGCTRWENRCTQWGTRDQRVQKEINLDFGRMPKLVDAQEQIYQLAIRRFPPGGEGEDWVSTDLYTNPNDPAVQITKWNDFNYIIQPK